jgi:hypothetical protein
MECSELCPLSALPASAGASSRQIWPSALEAAGVGSSTSAGATTGNRTGSIVLLLSFTSSSSLVHRRFQATESQSVTNTDPNHAERRFLGADSNLFIGYSKNSIAAGPPVSSLGREIASAAVDFLTVSPPGKNPPSAPPTAFTACTVGATGMHRI